MADVFTALPRGIAALRAAANAPMQANVLAATLRVVHLRTAISSATEASATAIVSEYNT